MSTGDTIDIADRDGFGAKVTTITEASAELGAMSSELDTILAGANDETSTFTADGAQAPIYTEAVTGIAAWTEAVKTAATAAAADAEACAGTLDEKFTKITAADDAAAAEITRQ